MDINTISAINSTSLQTTLLLVFAVLAIFVAIDKGLTAFDNLFRKRRGKREEEQNTRLQSIENALRDHQLRLDEGDSHFDAIACDMTHLLNAQNALLMHEITGNSVENLKSVKSDLDRYLASRN